MKNLFKTVTTIICLAGVAYIIYKNKTNKPTMSEQYVEVKEINGGN